MRIVAALAFGLPFAPAIHGSTDLQKIFPESQGIVLTQLPRGAKNFNTGARIVRIAPAGERTVLSAGFSSAADPEVSFDGKRVLFAGKRTAQDHWQIYELTLDDLQVRQLTHEDADCRHPLYQSRIFYLDSERPWHQVAFVREEGGRSDLFSVKPDGSARRRLTYNLARNYEPAMVPDGRMIFGVDGNGVAGLFGINLDGTDYALFAPPHGLSMRMPAITARRAAIFVESSPNEWDAAGRLASVPLRRSLRLHNVIAPGLFHSPSALPDGTVLISMREAATAHAVYRMDPDTRKRELLVQDPDWHDVQARLIVPRDEPDGRSSVVEEDKHTGKLYCLSIYTTDIAALKPGTAKRLRIIDGSSNPPGTRLIGEAPIETDGSFNVEIPANTPVRLQVLDSNGVALQTTPWIWAKNKENRGCIGCHEDRELVPENRLAEALNHPSAQLVQEEAKRRTVDFERDIKPLLTARCANAACHGVPHLEKSIRPGQARSSALVAALLNDRHPASAKKVRKTAGKPAAPRLTDEEKRAIIEWIDLGAFKPKEQSHATLARGAAGAGRLRGGPSAAARLH